MRYKLKNDITNGYKPNSNELNLLFHKGDIVEGTPYTSNVGNKKNLGIDVKPTVANAYIETDNGLQFISLEQLETVPNNTALTVNPISNFNYVPWLIGGTAILILGYFLFKK